MSGLIHVDVCSGIGAFGVAAAHAGFHTAAFCEIEDYPRRVLARHFPKAYIHGDIKTLTGDTLCRHGAGQIDLFTGGFPCTDICTAGSGGGLDGKRSGLWFEQLRIITETRPRFVVAENVTALKTRGADTVLAGLEAAGYTAEAFVVGAWAAGAPHRRERVWVVAHSCGLANAETHSAPDPLGAKRDTWDYDGRSGGAALPRTSGAVAEPRMGRGFDGPPAGMDGLRWPSAPGASPTEWEPSIAAPKTAHHDERMKACGNAIVWPVAAAIFHAIREVL